jgi:hypothetical protein
VALRPRLLPGVPLSRDVETELSHRTGAVKTPYVVQTPFQNLPFASCTKFQVLTVSHPL